MAAKDYALSTAICEAIKEFDSNLIVLALSGGQLAKAAQDMELRTAMEVFADRGYEEDGTLVDRRKDGAMITDENEAIARVIRMVKEKKVTAVTGKDIPIQADSICVHGDGAKALAFVEKIRSDRHARHGLRRGDRNDELRFQVHRHGQCRTKNSHHAEIRKNSRFPHHLQQRRRPLGQYSIVYLEHPCRCDIRFRAI